MLARMREGSIHITFRDMMVLIDAKRLLDRLLSSGVGSGLAGSLAGGAPTRVLSGKQGRKFSGSALKVGGLALVGGLAYKAWQSYQQGASQSPAQSPEAVALPPAGSAFLPREDDRDATAALSRQYRTRSRIPQQHTAR
jgi:uncharacterized membrane protein YebE (DUF533 family)